jgi:poly-gamma-glutamate synthesis protein (capsule biosynthesis protein)
MDPLLIREDIARVRDQVDYVAVSLHWNIENTRQTHPDARTFAYDLVDAGADIVLGHHPHMPQGVEVYRGKVIFYSLGNMIFGHGHDYWGDGFLARLTLTPQQITKVEILPLAGTGSDLSQPYFLSGDRAEALLLEMQELTADLDTSLDIVGDVGVIAVAPSTDDAGGGR